MIPWETLLHTVRTGGQDAALSALYAPEGGAALDAARDRAIRTAEAFRDAFSPKGDAPAAFFSGPGRTEIGGNHTDHQHGHVLCGSVDMDMLCCAAPNGRRTVRILSEGYPAVEIDLDSLSPRTSAYGTSAALVAGVAAGIREAGYAVEGFDACVTSRVLSGSGLSSSAAYEILIANVFNTFFCGGELDAIQMAKIGQYAENVYFGKPCGLMDQMGASVGGAVAIDFADPSAPVVRKVSYDFAQSGHALCIVDTRSGHEDLTDDYAAIPNEMGAVASFFGKKYLREVPEAEFRAAMGQIRELCGDRAVLRAIHYYADDARAVREAEALEAGDFPGFLKLVNESGLSSALCLQNTWASRHPEQQAVPISLELGRELLEGTGAIRVHGGGFAGTIQAFVPFERLEAFRKGMEAVLGAGACHILRIRPQGGCPVIA